MTGKADSRELRRLRGLIALWCVLVRRIGGRATLRTAALAGRLWRIIPHLLPVSGAFVAVLGTLLMTSVNVQWLDFIPALLSRIDNRDVAWEALSGFEDPNWDAFDPENPAASFLVVSTLPSSATGFAELVKLVKSHVKRTPSGKVIAVQVSSGGYASTGRSIVGEYSVGFLLDGDDESSIVASMQDVAGWIRDDRLDWGLVHGFPLLLGGLFTTFLAETVRWRRR